MTYDNDNKNPEHFIVGIFASRRNHNVHFELGNVCVDIFIYTKLSVQRHSLRSEVNTI